MNFKKEDILGIADVFNKITGKDIRCLYQSELNDIDYIMDLFANNKRFEIKKYIQKEYHPKWVLLDESGKQYIRALREKQKYDFYNLYSFTD